MRSWLHSAAVAFLTGFFVASPAAAFQVEFSSDQFSSRTDVFSTVSSFFISIEVMGPLAPGVYVNPPLGDIEFLVSGTLDPTTPARTALPTFTAFAVDDLSSLFGEEFYALGNSLSFEISATADLSDGLQVSDLEGSGLVFEFDGRELDTGRYHPPILQIFSDGTGSIRNAANTGGINPLTGVEVNATVGDEYIQELTFDPSSLTLTGPEPPPVPGLTGAHVVITVLGLIMLAAMILARREQGTRPGGAHSDR